LSTLPAWWLVPAQGEGLGNKFLAHIRETDAIVNVVRCFEDPNVIHVAGKVDPIADIEVIQTELCLADLAAVEKALHRVTKTARSGDKESIKLVALLEKCQAALNDTQTGAHLDFSKEELPLLKQFFLITAKRGDVRRQRGRGRFREQPLPGPAARLRRGRRKRRWWPSAPSWRRRCRR
jgi:ribosome-binding ATPase